MRHNFKVNRFNLKSNYGDYE